MIHARRILKDLKEKKRKEEEERARKEEEERQKRIAKLGKDKVEAEEAAAKAEEEAKEAAEKEKIRALAAGEIPFGEVKQEEAPAEEKGEEEEKKKKKKKKDDGLERDKRGSIMMKKGMQLEIPINVDGRVTLGLGWKGGQWDMDASCLMFRFKQHRDDVYYYKPRSKDGAIIHRGGYAGLIRINPEEGDAEQIDINLQKVSAKTNTLIFVVTVFSPEGNFSSVQDAYVRLIDTTTQSEYCRYTLESGGNETARIMCRLYRYGFSKWRLQAIGEPSEGRLYKHMIPKVEPFLDDMPPKRRFRIRIHRGKLTDIKRMYKGESKTTSLNTYCELRLDTDKAKTKIIKKSLTPQWRSTAELKGNSSVLEVNVMHKARFGKEVVNRADFRKLVSSNDVSILFTKPVCLKRTLLLIS
jgi:tellurium resistance protein TerZ